MRVTQLQKIFVFFLVALLRAETYVLEIFVKTSCGHSLDCFRQKVRMGFKDLKPFPVLTRRFNLLWLMADNFTRQGETSWTGKG